MVELLTFNQKNAGSNPAAPTTKRCPRCKQSKPTTLEFFGKKDHRLQSWCRDCNKIRSRKYYADNPAKHKAITKGKSKEQIKRNQEYALDYLRCHPCVDCEEEDPVLLDFDHVRGQKNGNIGAMIHVPVSIKKLQAEIDKCEIRCVACHRRRTARAGGWFRFVAAPTTKPNPC